MDSNHVSATGFGIIGGLFAKVSTLAFITWSGAVDTAIYAAIGGVVGLTVAELWKFAKSKLSRKRVE